MKLTFLTQDVNVGGSTTISFLHKYSLSLSLSLSVCVCVSICESEAHSEHQDCKHESNTTYESNEVQDGECSEDEG